jgi:hypothetical protein
MKRLLAVTAAVEAVTGLVLFVYPPIVIKLLFGTHIAGVGLLASRFAGITLIALGVACWPCAATSCALLGMLTYGVLATLYLFYLALASEWIGLLLWPAVVLHAILTLLLARAWFKPQANRTT